MIYSMFKICTHISSIFADAQCFRSIMDIDVLCVASVFPRSTKDLWPLLKLQEQLEATCFFSSLRRSIVSSLIVQQFFARHFAGHFFVSCRWLDIPSIWRHFETCLMFVSTRFSFGDLGILSMEVFFWERGAPHRWSTLVSSLLRDLGQG